MSHIRLSICIPTYNFGKFIGETLASIVPQMTEEVEIVIVDGASTDDTEEIVQSFQRTYPRIYYKKLEKRGGIDRDMAYSVSLASGDYCWLFSSDDIMRRGAIEEILRKIESAVDVYLCGFTICDFKVQEVFWEHPISKITEETIVNLSDPTERIDYFRKGINTAAFFSFMSSLVINRKKWENIKIQEEMYGSCWAHVARIFSMISQGLKIKFIPWSFLRKRSFNDSFMERGVIRRYAIAIDGYHLLADRCFGHNTEEAYHMRRAVRAELPFKVVMNAKAHVANNEEKEILDKIIKKHYSDYSVINRVQELLYWLIPYQSLILLRLLWRCRRLLWRFRFVRIKYLIKQTLR